MKNKKGIIVSIEGKIASILTQDGEFLNVHINKQKPHPDIGEEYEGRVVKNIISNSNLFKYMAACLIFFIFLSGGAVYAYYTPVSTVTININPSIELKLNRWNRVIKSTGLNQDGIKILNEVNIKNDVADKALSIILERSKKDNFINEDYIKENKIISLNINGKNIDLSEFKKEINKENLNLVVDKNGSEIFNISNNSNKGSDKEQDSKKAYNNDEKKTNESVKVNDKSTINNSKGILKNESSEGSVKNEAPLEEKSKANFNEDKPNKSIQNSNGNENNPAKVEKSNSNKEDKNNQNENKKDKN